MKLGHILSHLMGLSREAKPYEQALSMDVIMHGLSSKMVVMQTYYMHYIIISCVTFYLNTITM